MISEVDLRDWDKVDFTPFQKKENGRYPVPTLHQILDFVDSVERLRDKQLSKMPAILRKEN